jgi:CBS domain-containing protein
VDVSRIMNRRRLTVPAQATAAEALRLMDDEDVRHLAVLEEGRLVGVVSDRDLVGVVGSVAVPGAGPRAVPVRDVLRAPLVTIGPEASAADAARELMRKGIGCLPVVHGSELAGLVTELDVLAAYAQLAGRSRPGTGLHPRVATVMTSDPHTVAPDASFEEASALCGTLGVRHLPVVEQGRLVGLLSDRDLRAAAGDGRPGETPVRELMSTEVITVSPNDGVAQAARLLVSNRFSSVPVVTAGRLVGLVTVVDLLVFAMRALEGDRDESRGAAGPAL